jgi:nitroimidazol reductase NimA-like FMN-containing flavoprotein (pyridoxamine 5'-phosphate oxidase superfamily)
MNCRQSTAFEKAIAMTQDTPCIDRQPYRVDAAEKWIKTFLHCAPFGILAVVNEGLPRVFVSLFGYDEAAHAIYMRPDVRGRAGASIKAGQQVSFTVGEMGRILPADTAIDFGIEHASVTVCGHASMIQKTDRACHALQLILNKYAPHLCPGQDYQPICAEDIQKANVLCIHIDSWNGLKNEALADFPRAYHYVEQPMLPSNYWRGINEV